ncbi:MAG: DUF6776 family protein [Pseudomonadota bacterium]
MPVKGPRLHRMVVKAERPGQRLALAALVLLLCAGIGSAAFVAGRVLTLRALAGGDVDDGTMASVERLVESNAALRDELAIYRGGGDVAREVEERVRTENRGLQDRVAELEQALADYRRVLVPDPAGKGLRIEKLEIASSVAPGTWLLRVVLVRAGDTDSAAEGDLEGQLHIDSSAGRLIVPLSQLITADRRHFRVRYVEERMIDLQLPAGQTPAKLDLVAVLSSPRVLNVEKTWQRQVRSSPTGEAVKPQGVTGNAGQG